MCCGRPTRNSNRSKFLRFRLPFRESSAACFVLPRKVQSPILAFSLLFGLFYHFVSVGFGLEGALFGSLVVAQAQEDRMSHATICGPFREFDLGHQFWLNPMYRFIGLDLFDKGRGARL